jgi:hypothetical protein
MEPVRVNGKIHPGVALLRAIVTDYIQDEAVRSIGPENWNIIVIR